MTRIVSLEDLRQAVAALLDRPGRQIVAIAGAPGSGKSTLVDTLHAALDRDAPGA